MRAWVAISAVLLCACASAGANRSDANSLNATAISTVDVLLGYAATDFRAQRAPQPVEFRNVRIGYVLTSDGAKQHRLCGEFLPAGDGGKGNWSSFATIQTDPYEQWLGGSTLTFCKDPGMKWDREDLTARMQARFKSLR